MRERITVSRAAPTGAGIAELLSIRRAADAEAVANDYKCTFCHGHTFPIV